ncbi:MAG: LysM peptidoglycan-binding domain-containing protein, partial [Gammaproteobacteria bacterium]|nr:LysM peptidoglycan-binding domain-containing protein [Gammaproteobacteria bacterium]
DSQLIESPPSKIVSSKALDELKLEPEVKAEVEIEIEIDKQLKILQVEEEANDLWLRLRDGMQLPELDNARIKAQRDWFVKHKDYLQRVMTRAKPILPFILDEIEARGLPTEYALLPIVESAYQTYAYSHGRASGIWQIIPSTGRYLGLTQNWWYDGRRDIHEASKAALKYLDMLAKQFDGNPVLALASYNAGPGKIRSAIRYNKKKKRPTDFWNLTKIRKETRDYVPKLYALKQIFSQPELYGINLLPVSNDPGFEIVTIKQQIDISKAAELADMTLNEFYVLNPAFNHWATPPKGSFKLLLPIGKKATFEENYAKLPASERIKWVRHKIRSGDTLSQIAVKYNTQVSLIKNVNKIKNHQIRAGKYLMVPTSTKSLHNYAKSQASRLARTQNKKRGKQKIMHTVQSGDSFWSIGQKYDVSHKSIAKWNGMAPIDTLSIGHQLVIWDSNKNPKNINKVSFNSNNQSHIKRLRYTVRKGDSVARIADKFNIKVSDIEKWNQIGKYIQPGQKIKLWVDVTSQSI